MATYIYAITRADHPMRLDGLEGVGEQKSELRTVGTRTLSAVVSEAPDDLRAKRRDLVAHQSVLERLLADGAALPMRFGLVGPDDAHVAQVLEENQDAYVERLQQINGCMEYNLKISRDEQDMLYEIIEDSDEVRRLNERTRENPAAHDDKMALGELIANEVQAREEREAASFVSRLERFAVGHSLGEPTKSHFLNVSFLVDRGKVSEFTEAVDEEAKACGEAYSFNLHGPLPPYSFV